MEDVSHGRPLLPRSVRLVLDGPTTVLHTRLVDEFVRLAACNTINPADPDVASGLPAPLEAPSKSLGFDRGVGQPSVDLLSGAFLELPDRCELVEDAGDNGVDLTGEPIHRVIRGSKQRRVAESRSKCIEVERFQLPVEHDGWLPSVEAASN
jgi:hypothetical protein